MILPLLCCWGSSMDPMVGLGNHSLGLGTSTKPEPGVPVASEVPGVCPGLW